MICKFLLFLAGKLLYLFSLILPNRPAAYTNMLNYIKTNIPTIINSPFLDIPFITSAIASYVFVLIVIFFVFFIWKIIKLIRG